MPLVQAKCTNCGATLQVDNAKDAAVCAHCGAAFIVEKAIHNYSVTNNIKAGEVNVFGTQAPIENLLHRAETFYKLGEKEQAMTLWKQAVESYPDDYRGWWNLCKYHELESGHTIILYSYLKGFKNALALAPKAKKQELIDEYDGYWEKALSEWLTTPGGFPHVLIERSGAMEWPDYVTEVIKKALENAKQIIDNAPKESKFLYKTMPRKIYWNTFLNIYVAKRDSYYKELNTEGRTDSPHAAIGRTIIYARSNDYGGWSDFESVPSTREYQ